MPNARTASLWPGDPAERRQQSRKQLANDALDVVLLAAALLTMLLVTLA